LTTTTSSFRQSIFESLDGKFIARLREIASSTRTTADGKATISFRTARVEAVYSPDVIKKIEAGRLIAIPNVMSVGTNDSYSIYEIADVYPMHYSMLTLDRSQPGAIRKEFMAMIEKEWQTGSKSTWIEIVAAPTGYVMQLYNSSSSSFSAEENEEEGSNTKGPNFVRKSISPLPGSQAHLLSKETIQKFICYAPRDKKQKLDDYTIGHLLGVTESQVPLSINIEKMLHYHVGVFAFTGSGKSNFTSLAMRKAVSTVPDVKFVIFDVSSEYGINVLDLLRSYPSRVIFTEHIRGKNNAEKAEDYLRRHVVPEALAEEKRDMLLVSIEEMINADKVRKISIESGAEQGIQGLNSYAGLIGRLADIAGDRYGAAAQKILVPTVTDMIRKFISDNNIEDLDISMGKEILPLIQSVEKFLAGSKSRQDAPYRHCLATSSLPSRTLSKRERIVVLTTLRNLLRKSWMIMKNTRLRFL
jgi:hypothetical protein